MNLLLPTMIAALLVAGMGVALLGSLKLPLAERLQIDEAKIGGLVSLFGFVMIPSILAVGFFTDLTGSGNSESIGKPLVMCAGFLLMAVSLLLLSRCRSYMLAVVAVVLFSASWAITINVGNVLTPATFGGSKAFAFNLANVFFGLGAFLTPMTVALLVRRTSFTIAVSALMAACVIPTLLALGANDPIRHAAGADPGLGVLLGNPMLWLCGMALFFYGPLEASLAAWTTTFLGDHGVKESTAANLLSAFWLAFMSGRLTTALLLPNGWSRALVFGLGLVCIVLLLGFFLCRDRNLAMILVPAAGFIFGPIFPTLIGVLLGTFPESVHGRAVGFFFAVGGIGWTIVPMLIGIYAKRTSVQRGFLVAVGAAVGLSVIALAILLR